MGLWNLSQHLLLGGVVFLGSVAQGSELLLSHGDALERGFSIRSIQQSNGSVGAFLKVTARNLSKGEEPRYERGSLDWPFHRGTRFTLGNSMPQLQTYDTDNYFHGGCDLVVERDTAIVSPVSGRVEAGYYASLIDSRGYGDRAWISLKEYLRSPERFDVREQYFEVAVIDDAGTRFQFHHIARQSLPKEIVQAAVEGSRVAKGTELGRIIAWRMKMEGHAYDHVHYDILGASGESYNCEWYSKPTDDITPPSLRRVYAVDRELRATVVPNDGTIKSRPSAIGLWVYDTRDSGPFKYMPCFIEIAFGSGTSYQLDFTKTLRLGERLPEIFEVFFKYLWMSSGQVPSLGNYQQNQLLVRIPLRPRDFGISKITVQDGAGNQTVRSITLPKESI